MGHKLRGSTYVYLRSSRGSRHAGAEEDVAREASTSPFHR
jgi:hypothetical protein